MRFLVSNPNLEYYKSHFMEIKNPNAHYWKGLQEYNILSVSNK